MQNYSAKHSTQIPDQSLQKLEREAEIENTPNNYNKRDEKWIETKGMDSKPGFETKSRTNWTVWR